MRAVVHLALAVLAGCGLDTNSIGSDESGPGSTSSETGMATAGSVSSDGDTTAGPISTTGPDGSTAAGPDIVDEGLLARWWVDEATSGADPALLADAVAPVMDLPISYVASWPQFVEVDGSAGLYWDQIGLDGRALAPTAGTKLDTELRDSTRATFELVVSVQNVHPETSRLLHIGPASAHDFVIGTNSLSQLEVRWRDLSTMRFETVWSGSRQIVHVVIDTTEGDAVDRVRAYVDGVELIPLSETGPEDGVGFPLNDGSSLVLGNRNDGQRSVHGAIHYAAIYLEALDPTQLMTNVGVLQSDDDGP